MSSQELKENLKDLRQISIDYDKRSWELAKLIGVSTRTMQRWLSGQRHCPKVVLIALRSELEKRHE